MKQIFREAMKPRSSGLWWQELVAFPSGELTNAKGPLGPCRDTQIPGWVQVAYLGSQVHPLGEDRAS